MKKIISLVATLGFASSVFAGGAVTVAVLPNTMTNLLSNFPGYAYVQQVTVSANATNASVLLVDTVTNSLTYTVSAYTNILRYATNYYVMYTNYYGVTNYTYTNTMLVDVTNNVVPAATNSYPIRLAASALANTSVIFGNTASAGYYFDNGIWATNNSSGIATVTIQYR